MQVRDLDAGVQERLKAAAAARGQSLSEFLRIELARLADQLEVRSRAAGLREGLLPGMSAPMGLRKDFDLQSFLDDMRRERDGRE